MMAEQKLKNGANMNISEAGLSLIKKFEGCALESYLCPAGVWTIGYGHTKDVKEGDKINNEEADYLLQEEMPEYEFIVCQEFNFTKDQYHKLLESAKIVFSANLQETLGISCYEGALAGALPMVPDRLSYSEMYTNEFKYPSEWTRSWSSYKKHKQLLLKLNEVYTL